jgi:hypothetical protein
MNRKERIQYRNKMRLNSRKIRTNSSPIFGALAIS